MGTEANVRFAQFWLKSEEEAGRTHGPGLLSSPTGMWRLELNRDSDFRRYGTLRFLLDQIHDDVIDRPGHAKERAAIVVEYVDSVDVPSEHYRAYLCGYAWKVYANALRYSGEFTGALKAARYSYSNFMRVGSLAGEAAKARLVEALVLREQGHLDEVLLIARESAEILRDHQEADAYMNAKMTEALALSDARRHKEAFAIFQQTGEEAEARGDKRMLAICLHNSAELARALGDLDGARKLDARALTYFEEIGGAGAYIPSIRWTEGLALADEGRTSAAILLLYKTRAEFLALGMNGSAADVGLEIVRLRFNRGDDVTSECIELIETMTKAGMTQSSIEALAYLREQARAHNVSPSKIEHARKFIRETSQGPARLFLPPQE